MKLYWAPNTRSQQALWALEEAGCDYECEFVDVMQGHGQHAEYRAINPMGKVPTLEDAGVTITESAAIAAYLADRSPDKGLAPSTDDPARGRYYRWLFFSPACIEPALTQKAADLKVSPGTAGWGSYERVVETLANELGKDDFLMGKQFTMADLLIASGLRFGMFFKMIEPRPVFETYVQRCTGRPAFARAQEINDGKEVAG
ncbi:MAG: glutathione S-transferase family protein [Pseudomonadota bacterium]